jgi:hypothetical protein
MAHLMCTLPSPQALQHPHVAAMPVRQPLWGPPLVVEVYTAAACLVCRRLAVLGSCLVVLSGRTWEV